MVLQVSVEFVALREYLNDILEGADDGGRGVRALGVCALVSLSEFVVFAKSEQPYKSYSATLLSDAKATAFFPG